MGNTQTGEDNEEPRGALLQQRSKQRLRSNGESIVRVGSQIFNHVDQGEGNGNVTTSATIRADNYDHVRRAAMYNLHHVGGLDPNRGVPGVVGLRNLGNTCYMNSALQCLSNTVPLADYFLGYDYRKEINSSNALGSCGELATAYAKLQKKFWLKPAKSINDTRVINLKGFRSKIHRYLLQFEGDEQHDAHEFLAVLLDKIHEDLNRVEGVKPYVEESDISGADDHEKAAIVAWQRHLMRDKSVIVDMFQGQLRSSIKCRDCGYQNVRFDAFMYLSLPVNDKSKSLDHCLADYIKEEDMTDGNQWYCRECKKLADATKQTDLWVLPPVLIIQLKRFKHTHIGGKCVKVDTKLKYPIVGWDLSHVVKGGGSTATNYDLYASTNHFGDLDVGHYTACILNQFDKQWYEFDDNEHRIINPASTFRSSSSPYILFFSRTATEQDNGAPSINRQSISRPQLWPHLQERRVSKSRESKGFNREMLLSQLEVLNEDAQLGKETPNGTVMTTTVDDADAASAPDEIVSGTPQRATNYERIESVVLHNFKVAGCLKGESYAPPGAVGFRNLGNTSFLNSALQCLSNTVPLTDYFLGFDYRSEINSDNVRGSDNGELVIAYADLMNKIWLKTSGKRRVIVTKGFTKKLVNFAPMFKGSQKHDSHELLVTLLDGIHEDLNQAGGQMPIEEGTYIGVNDECDAIQSWESYLQRQDSLIVDLFQGQLRTKCECRTCGYVNVCFEAFMYLSLPIDGHSGTLDDCIAAFVAEEALVGANQWYCSNCKTLVDASRRSEIFALPPILIVHLNRFKVNDCEEGIRKIDTALKYPVSGWDLSYLVRSKRGGDARYDLYASSNHMGSIDSGHYTAYAQNRFSKRWYEFDDKKFREIDPVITFESSPSPYVLFYMCAESSLDDSRR